MNGLGILIPIIALMIPIVAIVMTQWGKVKQRQLDLQEKQGAGISEEAGMRIVRLEERVQVLERILTDKRTALSDQIEDLRN